MEEVETSGHSTGGSRSEEGCCYPPTLPNGADLVVKHHGGKTRSYEKASAGVLVGLDGREDRMNIKVMRTLLLWCTMINYEVLMVWFLAFVRVHDRLHRVHGIG